jgi:hypothetical protein
MEELKETVYLQQGGRSSYVYHTFWKCSKMSCWLSLLVVLLIPETTRFRQTLPVTAMCCGEWVGMCSRIRYVGTHSYATFRCKVRYCLRNISIVVDIPNVVMPCYIPAWYFWQSLTRRNIHHHLAFREIGHCWPVPVSFIQEPLQWSVLISSASWCIFCQ